ncbi:hypothetical protein E2C01_001130 [Portunus trituberculatus]|uniref:Uncharacterized protein n=1 Tax=Portunus trituberculatus TaxID=210409 RepID=A0A5B7CFX9_PORTR|nr:hypothetical protein [Portunus trituberculatus]
MSSSIDATRAGQQLSFPHTAYSPRSSLSSFPSLSPSPSFSSSFSSSFPTTLPQITSTPSSLSPSPTNVSNKIIYKL